jgi:tRNA pseudouridine55 synthase
MREPYSGFALLRKPEGITSFKALFPVKKSVASGKVGHAGTLDLFASGLLIVLVGPYSRLTPYVMSGEKRYRGLVSFGSETDTLDPQGEVIASAPLPDRASLESALEAFRGKIMQRPPAYSAVHVDGERAYERALRGEDCELKERPVEIRELRLLSYEDGKALLDVRCSSGTYIRSLARDIALACGSRAHLAALERLSIGPFRVEDAVPPQDFIPERDLRSLRPADAEALGLRVLGLGSEADTLRFKNGNRFSASSFAVLDGKGEALAQESAVFGPGGDFLGIIELEASGPRYKTVMPIRRRASA